MDIFLIQALYFVLLISLFWMAYVYLFYALQNIEYL